MKKALLLFLVVPFLFASCAASGLSSLVIKNWFLDSITDADGNMTEYPTSESSDVLGETVTIQETETYYFIDEGTGYKKFVKKTGANIESSKVSFVFEGDDVNKAFSITYTDGDEIGVKEGPYEYKVEGSTLTLTSSEETMVFTERSMPNFD